MKVFRGIVFCSTIMSCIFSILMFIFAKMIETYSIVIIVSTAVAVLNIV